MEDQDWKFIGWLVNDAHQLTEIVVFYSAPYYALCEPGVYPEHAEAHVTCVPPRTY